MGTGASQAQNQIAGSQQKFMQTLQQNYSKAFAGQQNILSSLGKSLTTTLNAGPSQFGFSAPETTALNTLATTQNAQAYQNARAAAGEAAANSGVSNAQLPTGAASGTQAQLAEEAATNQSNALLGVQEAGYKQGVQNYNEAVSGLSSTASIENPSGAASTANTAGGQASATATQIQKENIAASPWSQVGGLVGSLAGAALNIAAPGAGTALSALTSGLTAAQGANNSSAGQALSPQTSSISDTIPTIPLQGL